MMNIKTFALFLIICCAIQTTFAQDFYGGLLVGFNGSQIEGDMASGYNKIGFVCGAWVQRDLSEKVFAAMELKYNQKGSRINPTKNNDYRKYVYRLNYIDLPVLAGYILNDDFRFFGGCSFGVLVNKYGFDNYDTDPTVLYNGTKNWDLGMLAGMKVNLPRLVDRYWAEKFILDLRLQLSMLSIVGEGLFYNPYTFNQYNNLISFTLFYRVDI